MTTFSEIREVTTSRSMIELSKVERLARSCSGVSPSVYLIPTNRREQRQREVAIEEVLGDDSAWCDARGGRLDRKVVRKARMEELGYMKR